MKLPTHHRAVRRTFRLIASLAVLVCMQLHGITPAAASGIVTTLPPLAGLVAMLDPEAEVHCLLPPGADAHDFQITPRQVQMLKQADLLVRASFDDRHWSGIDLPGRSLDLWSARGHAWVSPAAVRDKLPELAAALQKLYPQHAAHISTALAGAEQACTEMDASWTKVLAGLRTGGVIMQHNAWQDMLTAHGVPVWSVLENGHHGESISPRRLQRALDLLQAHPGTVLWGNVRHASKGLQWLQEHAGGARPKLISFDPLGDCGMGWKELMQHNLDLLTGAVH